MVAPLPNIVNFYNFTLLSPSSLSDLIVATVSSLKQTYIEETIIMIVTMTTVSTTTAVVVTAGFLFVIHFIVGLWQHHFAGRRTFRANKNSPSNLQPPRVKRFSSMVRNVIGKPGYSQSYQDCDLLGKLKDRKVTKIDNDVIRQRGKRTSYFDQYMGHITSKSTRSVGLDMDHIYVGIIDFLWGFLFVGAGGYVLFVKATMWLMIRQFLVRYGILKVKECDIETVVGKLCLEQSQVVHYCTSSNTSYSAQRGLARKSFAKQIIQEEDDDDDDDDNEPRNDAVFLFVDFPWVDNNCDFQVADLFAVYIDLDTKKFIKANMDDINLTASETLILLWYNTIGAQHVKLHALANWGVNYANSEDKFIKRNSLVTIMYNFFGYTVFSTFFKLWEMQGLLSTGWSDKHPLKKSFDHGINANVGQHAQITELVDHSELVHFIVKVRAIFFNEFAKYKHLFPGVDGEAHFVGTVLHSLDHTLMEWNLDDPLWLDIHDSKFGKMAEIGRIVRVGFVPDLPMLYFHKRFKNSGHPFYDAVYEKAAKVNKKLADNMDTCIVK